MTQRLDRRAFEAEFPGTSGSATELVVNVVRTGEAFVTLANRALRDHHLSAAARQALAVVEGAGEPLPASVIAERMLVTSATTTSLIDTLEKRGLVRRLSDPSDRRRVLVDITDEARALIDAYLPQVAALQAAIVEPLSERDREAVIRALDVVRERIAAIDADEVVTAAPKRRKHRRR